MRSEQLLSMRQAADDPEAEIWKDSDLRKALCEEALGGVGTDLRRARIRALCEEVFGEDGKRRLRARIKDLEQQLETVTAERNKCAPELSLVRTDLEHATAAYNLAHTEARIQSEQCQELQSELRSTGEKLEYWQKMALSLGAQLALRRGQMHALVEQVKVVRQLLMRPGASSEMAVEGLENALAAVHDEVVCERCHGGRGGSPGNENIIDGKVLCDYCHADDLELKKLQARLTAAGL